MEAGIDGLLPGDGRDVVVIAVEAQWAAERERQRGDERVQLLERRVADEMRESSVVGPAPPWRVDQDRHAADTRCN